MTAVKACFKLLWDVCLQDLAKMLGYRTPRALMCCKACTNHHKSWMILTIFFYGTIDEILTTYISQDEAPTVAGLYTYIGSCKDRNFRFMCDVVLNYVLAIFAFRCGTRRNNTDYIMAGKSKFMKLFYGLNNTNYQEIMYRDFKTRVLAPTAVKDFICKNESFSVSGNISKGEGGDFVLEAYNRRAKRWLPPGIPKQHHWVNVCRNLNLLEKIRENTFKEMCMPEELDTLYHRDFSTEIFEWRVKMRSLRYLSNAREEYSDHTSVSGERLDVGLIRFERTCEENLNAYLASIERGMVPGKGLSLTPVFTTPLDRTKFHAIEKKTKQQITSIIEEGISDIHKHGNTDEAFVLETQWQKIRGKTKNEMLMFYKEVVVALENATAVESDTEDEDECTEDE
ncbi:uncharacterized protein LOC123543533 isoform X2 [Mercenaria mercenaria]|uniref:uncharacterized protein LOC123543533 isoform X2 n=2 Tax=Mercenaria mercenaria TaxID=6596 RepID=UPI00234E5BD9|nr:uncharacterized protein LOC123543533 isoform X2 [Mercenaria mercenaria]